MPGLEAEAGNAELAGQNDAASLGSGFQCLLLGAGLHADPGQDGDMPSFTCSRRLEAVLHILGWDRVRGLVTD